MDINQWGNLLNIKDIVTFSFKFLMIFFSAFYLLYSFVILKQTEVMNKTLHSKSYYLIYLISLLQVFFGFVLFLLSIFLI
jgi:hypothetical protein